MKTMLTNSWAPTEVTDKRLWLMYDDQLGGSDFEALAVATWAELHRKGWVTGTGPDWDSHVIGLIAPWEGNRPVAMIAFKELKWRREVQVALGGVVKDWRTQGVYTHLFRDFAREARERFPSTLGITSGYHVGNEASAAMHRRLQREVTHHVTFIGFEDVR